MKSNIFNYLSQRVVTAPTRTPDSSCTRVVCTCKVNKILDFIQVFVCASIQVMYPSPTHNSWNHNHNTTIMLYSYKIIMSPYASGKGPIPFGNASSCHIIYGYRIRFWLWRFSVSSMYILWVVHRYFIPTVHLKNCIKMLPKFIHVEI